MSNKWTDQLNMAKQEVVGPSFLSFLLISTQRKPVVGWSQIVFRWNQPVGEISPANANNSLAAQSRTAVKVKEGDVIVHVYRGLRSYHLTGIAFTKDKYKRLYEIELSLEVHHPIPVAKAYYQEKDPVQEAISQVQSLFEEYTQYCNHDQLPRVEPPFEEWNTQWLDHLGIAIRPKTKAMFREDSYYSELARMEQEKKNLKEKLALEKEIKRMEEEIKYEQEKAQKELEFEKKRIERDFARREEVKDQIHKICSELLQVAADEMKGTLQERVHEGFEKGSLTSEIWDELYTVLYAIGDEDRQINLEQQMVALMQSMDKARINLTKGSKGNTITTDRDIKPSLDPLTY